MNIHGIPKPTYCAFELLHELGTERFAVDGLHHTVDAWVVKKDDSASVLLTNHALPKHPIKTETVKVVLENVPDYSSAFVKRVDENHANSKKLWISMGKPEYLSAAQVEQLNEASRLINGKQMKFYDYKARSIPNGPDDGTIAPWAVVTSLPFAPEIVLPAIKYISDEYPEMTHKYGIKCSFNPTFSGGNQGEENKLKS